MNMVAIACILGPVGIAVLINLLGYTGRTAFGLIVIGSMLFNLMVLAKRE